MSRNFRPVVEKWGTYSSCFLDSSDLEQVIKDIASEDAANAGYVDANAYGYVRSVWIEHGSTFLDFIARYTHVEIYDMFSDWKEYEKSDITSVLENMRASFAEWRTMLKDDGSLTFYIDQYW